MNSAKRDVERLTGENPFDNFLLKNDLFERPSKPED